MENRVKTMMTLLAVVAMLLSAACGGKKIHTGRAPQAPKPAAATTTATTSTATATAPTTAAPNAQAPATQLSPTPLPPAPKPGELTGREVAGFTEAAPETVSTVTPVAESTSKAQPVQTVAQSEPARTASQIMIPQPRVSQPSTSADNQQFLEFTLVLPQAQEKLTLSINQVKAALAAIMSPKADESYEAYTKRVEAFRQAYQNTPRRYTEQAALINRVYTETTGLQASNLVFDGPYPRDQIKRITDKSQVVFPGSWRVFRRFRIDPLGKEINPNRTDAEIIAEIAKIRNQVIPQILRTTYTPAMKAEWIEKFNNCLNGDRGEAGGWCKIEEIYDWSRLWEYTSGRLSSAEKVEFIPDPEFRHAKALTLFLNQTGKDVGHAFPCGLNPIVAFTVTGFEVKTAVPSKPAAPVQCKCDVLVAKGNLPKGTDGAVILPRDQDLNLQVRLTGDVSRVEVRREQIFVDGVPKLGLTEKDRSGFVLNSSVFDNKDPNHVYTVRYRLEYVSEGQEMTTECDLLVRKEAPPKRTPTCTATVSVMSLVNPDDSTTVRFTVDNPDNAPVQERITSNNPDLKFQALTGDIVTIRRSDMPDFTGALTVTKQLLNPETGQSYPNASCQASINVSRPIVTQVPPVPEGPTVEKKRRRWLPYVIAAGAAAGAGIFLATRGHHEGPNEKIWTPGWKPTVNINPRSTQSGLKFSWGSR